jgi:hypothetical protein
VTRSTLYRTAAFISNYSTVRCCSNSKPRRQSTPPACLSPSHKFQETVDAAARVVETREALAIKRLVVSRKK